MEPIDPHNVPDKGNLRAMLGLPAGSAPSGPPRMPPIPMDQLPKEQRASKPRLTVHEALTHQIPGEQARSFGEPWCVELEADEQPYSRPGFAVGKEFVPLDTGWIEDGKVGVVYLSNTSKEHTVEITQEIEVRDYSHEGSQPFKVVTLVAMLPPLESMRWRPWLARSVRLRCPAGRAKVHIVVFPR